MGVAGFVGVQIGPFGRDRLAHDDRTCRTQAGDDPRILGRDAACVYGGAVFSRNALGVDDVFQPDRQTM